MSSVNACIPPQSLHGYGAILRYWDNAGDQWVIVAGLVDVPIPDELQEKVESNDDDGDGTTHYVPSPQTDLSDPAYTGDFLFDQWKRLHNIKKQRPTPILCWQVVLPTPDQIYFQWCGFLKELKATAQKKGLVTSEIVVGTTGGGLSIGTLQ